MSKKTKADQEQEQVEQADQPEAAAEAPTQAEQLPESDPAQKGVRVVVRAARDFEDAQTLRGYKPSEIITGWSRERAELYQERGLVVIEEQLQEPAKEEE